MGKIVWDAVGEREYETGTDHGVLYPWDNTANSGAGGYGVGVAWNGLTGVSQSPEGGEPTAIWADNIKYLNLMSSEEFNATVTCYTYPDEWAECDGSAQLCPGVTIGQQSRKTFGLSYRTVLGNDTESNDHGYKIHLVYGCLASPSQKDYKTVNDSPEAIEFSYEIKTTPVPVTGFKPTAHLEIKSTDFPEDPQTHIKTGLVNLENFIYGTDADATAGTAATDAKLPMPDDIPAIINGTYVAG